MDAPTPVATPAVERRIAIDLARHAVLVAPAVVVVAALVRGTDGAASAGLGLALAVGNFLLTAAALGWAARRSPSVLMTVSLGGFAVRMGLILAAMLAADALFGWVDVVVLGLTLFLTHVGLLFWEIRSVSLTLAAPGLRRDRFTGERKE